MQFGLLIGIITISSIALIYTIFNISVSEKKKYIGSLSSVGATTKQIFKIYLLEGLIITLIAIPIGLLLSFGLDSVLINIFDKLFKSIQGNILNTYLHATAEVDLYMVYSLISICISVVLVTLIVLISILAPIINISKITIMDMIRKVKYNKINKNTIKAPKFISRVFKITGDLAYKNIKRTRYKFITLIVSLSISIILVISINGYIINLKSYNPYDELDYNYTLSIIKKNNEEADYSKEILEKLKTFGLIDNVYGCEKTNLMGMIVKEEDVNSEWKKVGNKIKYLKSKVLDDGSTEFYATACLYDEETYLNYMKQLGKNIKLEKGECILVNYSNETSKYCDGLHFTNYKVGDTITLNSQTHIPENVDTEFMKSITDNFENQAGVLEEIYKIYSTELKIKEVTDIVPVGSMEIKSTIYDNIILIVSSETLEDITNKFWHGQGNNYVSKFYIQSSDTASLHSAINNIVTQYKDVLYTYDNDLSISNESSKNEYLIKELLLYSFLVLVCILSIINIFNIILSNLKARQKEFVELKAIGMSDKQLRKMLVLEGLFYGAISIIMGLIISIIVLYVLSTRMINTQTYGFIIPSPIIILTIISVYTIIFFSIWCGKRQAIKDNLSDIIKER